MKMNNQGFYLNQQDTQKKLESIAQHFCLIQLNKIQLIQGKDLYFQSQFIFLIHRWSKF